MGALREAIKELRAARRAWISAPPDSADELRANNRVWAAISAVLDAYDARRARKAARTKPAAGDDVTRNVARAIWAEHGAAGERAAVDVAAVDTLLYELTTASQRYGWWLHKRSDLPAQSQADRDAALEADLAAIATETARVALRALVLGNGEGVEA